MSNSNKNKIACYELINDNDFYGKAGRRLDKQQFNLLPNKHKDLFNPIYFKNFSKDKYNSMLEEISRDYIGRGAVVQYFNEALGLNENNIVEALDMAILEDGDIANEDYEENFF